jgi:hypothetical protein
VEQVYSLVDCAEASSLTGFSGYRWAATAGATYAVAATLPALPGGYALRAVSKLRWGARLFAGMTVSHAELASALIVMALAPVAGGGIAVLRMARLARSVHLLRHLSHARLWRLLRTGAALRRAAVIARSL